MILFSHLPTRVSNSGCSEPKVSVLDCLRRWSRCNYLHSLKHDWSNAVTGEFTLDSDCTDTAEMNLKCQSVTEIHNERQNNSFWAWVKDPSWCLMENSETCLEVILLTDNFLYFSVYFRHNLVLSLSIAYILMQYRELCILIPGWTDDLWKIHTTPATTGSETIFCSLLLDM